MRKAVKATMPMVLDQSSDVNALAPRHALHPVGISAPIPTKEQSYEFIRDMAKNLARMARQQDCPFLSYLLGMAASEAGRLTLESVSPRNS
jgi:hypothetical protein